MSLVEVVSVCLFVYLFVCVCLSFCLSASFCVDRKDDQEMYASWYRGNVGGFVEWQDERDRREGRGSTRKRQSTNEKPEKEQPESRSGMKGIRGRKGGPGFGAGQERLGPSCSGHGILKGETRSNSLRFKC